MQQKKQKNEFFRVFMHVLAGKTYPKIIIARFDPSTRLRQVPRLSLGSKRILPLILSLSKDAGHRKLRAFSLERSREVSTNGISEGWETNGDKE